MKKVNVLVALLCLVFSVFAPVQAKTPIWSQFLVVVIKNSEIKTHKKEIEKKLGRTLTELDGQVHALSSAECEKICTILNDGSVNLFERRQLAGGKGKEPTQLHKFKSVPNPDGSQNPIGAGFKLEFQIFGVSNTPKEGLIVELSGEFGNEGSHGFATWKNKTVNQQIENGGAVAFVENGMFVLISAQSPE
jgi:hypothetical protein